MSHLTQQRTECATPHSANDRMRHTSLSDWWNLPHPAHQRVEMVTNKSDSEHEHQSGAKNKIKQNKKSARASGRQKQK